MLCKVLTRLFGVLRDRRAQRRQAFELGLVAQLPEKAHAQAPAIEIAAALEQMDFEQRRGHGIHGGAQADARNRWARIYSFGVYLDHVNTRERRTLPQRDVRRREAEIVPELRAVDHAPADRVSPSEQPPGTGEIARLERGPDGRARYALAVKPHVRHRLQHEA